MNSHPAEDRERLDKIFIVLREKQIVEFIDQLNDTDYLAGRILDGHTKNCTMPKAGTIVHQRIESRIFVSIRYIDSLKNLLYRLGH